jgi:hypothetical protein
MDHYRNGVSFVLRFAALHRAGFIRAARAWLPVLAASGLILAAPSPPSFRDQQWRFPRVRTAAKEKDEAVKQLLASKRLRYPPKAILLRAFKKEGLLELWTENDYGTYTLAKTYSICATSGVLGPKRRFGDEQVRKDFMSWIGSIRRATSI